MPAGVARLLDANLNRAREGIRVVEDTVRFIHKDLNGYRKLRNLRHQLDEITRDKYFDFLKARDSWKDHGRLLKEGSQKPLLSIVPANLRRAEEATRVLEEYMKVFSPALSAKFKEIRFQLYEIEKEFAQHL